MNKSYTLIAVLFGLSLFLLQSCEKDVRKGCMDPHSLNYNVLAKEDDGSCLYLDSTFTIWSNGELGYWGPSSTGGFSVTSCRTGITTIFLNADTTIVPADTIIVPADTIINNLVFPPDTTIIPADTIITAADTTITGDTHLLVNSDASGKYELIIKALNKRSAMDFKNGYLVFYAKLHPLSTITSFEVIIHGNHAELGGPSCANLHESDPVVVTTSILDTTSFKEVTIPLINFTNRYMQEIDLVFGIKGSNATPNTPLIIISDVKWVSNL